MKFPIGYRIVPVFFGSVTIEARESRPVDLLDHLHRSESAVIKI
jgi:hypothetical protein